MPSTCELGIPGPQRDRLVAAVLRGEKTATSSLLAEWESEGASLPPPGERQVLVDSSGQPVGVIEIVSATRIRLGDADERLARDEGEGFENVAAWRAAHVRFWRREVLPALAIASADLTDDTMIVVERFVLI